MADRILLVDDSLFLREMLRGLMKAGGYETETAISGDECLEKLDNFKPDLIILDVVMEGMDGFEVARNIRKVPEYKSVPIIFLTSRDSRDSKTTGFESGGDDYVLKPFDHEELLARVRRRLDQLHKARESESSARTETLSQLMITVAHHINNALTSVQGAGELIDVNKPESIEMYKGICGRQLKKIRAVVATLEKMASSHELKTTQYIWEGTEMLDIEDMMNEELKNLE